MRRTLEQSLKNAERLKKEIPELIQPEAEAFDMVNLADEIKRLQTALYEIANEEEIHTKLNQYRLCCKFQSIAMRALDIH